MFTAHWSNDQVTYKHMESVKTFCKLCRSEQKHTFRRYEKPKSSMFSDGSEISITLICHGCLLERTLDKDLEETLIAKYDLMVMTDDAFEILEAGEAGKAVKEFKKILAEFPEHPQAIYGMAKCLIIMGKYVEAKKYVDTLGQRYPDHSAIEELRDELNSSVP